MIKTINTKILFIQTGGTIDKDYPKRIKSYTFEIASPAVERILRRIYPCFRYKIITLMRKDSLDLTEKDRDLIYKTCAKFAISRIIITHGTDTMIKTAKKLSSIKNKVIVLTGSLLPERFINSDASFNIGMAVGAVNTLKNGIYIVMSGNIYPWYTCKKSIKTARYIKN